MFLLDQLEKCKNCQMYVQGSEVLMNKVFKRTTLPQLLLFLTICCNVLDQQW
jgi:hypothetical protein